jgi:phosphoserine phosphatase RsbU/P
MNPFARMSPRTIRIIYAVFGLAVLAVSALNVVELMVYKAQSNDQCLWVPVDSAQTIYLVTDIVPGGVADEAGLKDGDLLYGINGIRFKSAMHGMVIINQLHAGDIATYLIRRGGREIDVPIRILKTFDVAYLAQVLLGLGFWIVGMFVVLARPQGRVQRAFARFSILSMLFFCVGHLSLNSAVDAPWKIWTLITGFTIGRVFGPPAFVAFFLKFPLHKQLHRRWVFFTIVYAISIASTGLLLFGKYLAPPEIVMRYLWLTGPSFYLIGFGIFIHSYLRSVDVGDRIKLRPVLHAVVIGAAAYLYTVIVAAAYPIAIFIAPYLYLPSLLIAGVPPAFGYAIVRYRLMDVQVIIKRSISYGVVTATVAALYLALVFGVGSLLGSFIGNSESQFVTLVAVLVVAFVFDPIKQRVQHIVDRLFFRERYNYQHALLAFSSELPQLIDLDRILRLIIQRISTTMHVDVVSVSLCSDQEGCATIAMNVHDEDQHYDTAADGLGAWLRRTRAPQSFALPAEDFQALPINTSDKEKISRSGIMLSVPMFLKDMLIGTINVGEKKSGTLYSQEDIDLLSTVAGQAAVAIENARLHRSELERQKMLEELAIARRIQIGLLPKEMPAVEGLDVAGRSIPALSVGGDYFDFIPIGSDRLLVVVADVSGKGIPAALYMSKVQGMIQLAAGMFTSVRDILTHVNRLLYDGMERNAFITMVAAIFDTRAREVSICRAGHTLPIVGCNDHLGWLEARGIGLGLERGPVFDAGLEEVRRAYTPGELFVFYSDGLTETMDARHNEFGAPRLLSLVQSLEDEPAHVIEHEIVRAASVFKGEAEQHDDVTVVVVRAV